MEEIKLRIKRAEEALKTAELAFENKLYLDSISRSYYSVYNSIIAFFLKEDFPLPKTHAGMIAILWENRKRISKVISEKEIKYIHRLLQLREESDYAVLPLLGKKEAMFALRTARKILKNVKAYVGKNNTSRKSD